MHIQFQDNAFMDIAGIYQFQNLLRQSPPIQAQPQTLQETCEICYIHYTKVKQQQLRPAHICYGCWYQHIKTNVTKISYMVGASLMSPFQYEDQIDICMALNGLKQQHKDQVEELLYKKYTTFTKDIQKCPSETCDFVFTTQKCKWATGVNHLCPKCQTQLNVSQNVTLKSVLGFVYFIFMANKCPKCEIPIQRISGCPHMTCPCGHEFCWFCLKDHATKPQNLYTVHEPKQCASIFISKIIILLTCLMSLSCFLVGGETLRHFMQMAFELSAYVIHSIVIDLWIVAQLALHNMYRDQPYRNLPLQRSSIKVKIMAFTLLNLMFIGVLFMLDVLSLSLAIVFVELVLIGFGALVIYGVIYSSDTWFEFIT